MANRENIPKELERRVLLEAGHRCAIPACKQTPVEIAHIIPWRECQKHEFHNLIALCPNCHTRYDKGEIDRKCMEAYKHNLTLMNSRYGSFEIRVLKRFIDDENYIFWLPEGLNNLIWYLIEDKIIEDATGTPWFGGGGMGMNRMYQLTDKGRELLKKWQEADIID
jgi:hypothetical protein